MSVAKKAGKGIGVIGYCYGGLIELADCDAWGESEDAAVVLRWLLCGRDRVGGEGGAELPGDAALWGEGRSHREGPD